MKKRDVVVILVLTLALIALCLSSQVMFGLLEAPVITWPDEWIANWLDRGGR